MEASITVWPPVAVHHTTRDAMIGVCVLTPSVCSPEDLTPQRLVSVL